MKKRLKMFQIAPQQAAATANTTVEDGDGYVLHKYPDYETYRQVQEDGNKAKLRAQFVKESHIAFLADHLNASYGKIEFALCHGVRRGREQAWFRKHLTGAPEVIGTDISETAKDFPDTVQWDFHNTNPDWTGRADFVYSNSWDHAFDPKQALLAWVDALRPGGQLLLDHTRGHLPKAANALDPFGVTEAAFTTLLTDVMQGHGRVLAPLDRSQDKDYACKVFVCVKNS